MEGFSTSQLALLVYRAAQDRTQWPQLVEALRETANPFDDERVYADPQARRQLLDELVPHIRQALDMAETLEERDTSQALLNRTLEMLPMGIALVDADINILTMNRLADQTLRESGLLANHGGRLRINNREQQQHLHQHIESALQHGSSHALMLADTSRPVSLLVCPADLVRDDSRADTPAVTLFISNPDCQRLIDEQALIDLYGLTTAEAGLTQELIQGHGLADIAKRRGVSEQTVRTQLKAVFRKTDTRRQAELVSLVLSGLAPLSGVGAELEAGVAAAGADVPASRFVMRDGRPLHYAQYGDPAGLPVIFFHSVRGSCQEVPGDEQMLRDLGVRLILPERPGYGRSGPLPERDMDDICNDIRALADHLELAHFHLLGYSLGGFLALHCAARLGDRVTRLGLVSSLAPPRGEGGSPLKGMMRLAVALADKAPSLAETILDQMARGILRNPRRHLGSSVDRVLFSDSGYRECYLQALRESCRQGSGGFVQDLQAVARTPAPASDTLTMPVYLWHGEQDGQVPAEQALRLDNWLTNSELTLLPDGGHFFIYERWPEILARFTAED